eukprot:scaffold1722_cov120-Cylindrotheca_fusiformis.AAC.25
MKHRYSRSFLLLAVALQQLGVESRTWRSHSLVLPGLKTQPSLAFPIRGGDQSSHVPIVPDDTIQNDVPQGVSRGGSTKTEKYPDGVSVTTFTPTIVPASASPAENVTSLETHNSHASHYKNDKKSLKRHKQIAKKLKNRNATNLRRKVLHACFGFFFAGLNHFVPKAQFVPGMTALTSICLTVELLRYRKGFGWMNEALHFFLGSSLRKHEMDGKFTGSFYYFLGVTLTAALYPTSCATLGILQLAIADPTASYFGRHTRHIYWSRIENSGLSGLGGLGRNKGILGFLGGAVACVPMNYRLLSLAKFGHTVTRKSLLTASLALGLAGAFADLAVPTPTLTLPKKVCGVRVPPFHVDDNFVVPVFSGFACKKLFEAMQWSADLDLATFLIL